MEAAAQFDSIVAERRSVRAFLPQRVPQSLIEHLLTVAGKAPSNCNAQPWIVHVVSGEALARLRGVLLEQAKAGVTDPDVPITRDYAGDYKARRIGAAVALFSATGVSRDDEAARTRSYLRNYEMFDAPHVAFFFMPRQFGLREAADIGMYAQTLMLALTAHGLGSCAQGAISHYAAAVKRALGVADDLLCLFGMSFGYPDEADPSGAAITGRAPLSDTVTFHESP